MLGAAAGGLTVPVISVAGAAIVAAIGGGVTIYQARTIQRRGVQRDDYSALWSEVRLRDADADRLRATITSLFEQLQQAREENIRLDGELAVARAQVLQQATEMAHIREQGAPGVYHS